MEKRCIERACLECSFHVIDGGKLYCNVNNRLKEEEPKMSFFGAEKEVKR